MKKLSEAFNESNELSPELQAEAVDFMTKLATVAKEFKPLVRLYVLEAALQEQISEFAPPLGDLFGSMMVAYKKKAAILLVMAELVKEHNTTGSPQKEEELKSSINDLLEELRAKTSSKTPSGSI